MTEIKINDQTIKISDELEIFSTDQYEAFASLGLVIHFVEAPQKEKEAAIVELFPLFAALHFQPILDGYFDYEKALTLSKSFKEHEQKEAIDLVGAKFSMAAGKYFINLCKAQAKELWKKSIDNRDN